MYAEEKKLGGPDRERGTGQKKAAGYVGTKWMKDIKSLAERGGRIGEVNSPTTEPVIGLVREVEQANRRHNGRRNFFGSEKELK